MLNFLLLAGIITVAILIVLVRPLFVNKNKDSSEDKDAMYDERRQQNILFARQRLAELEEQLQDQKLSKEEYKELKTEIENNLALDLNKKNNEPKEIPVTEHENNKNLVLGLCLTLPLMAAGIYWLIGTPEALTNDQLTRHDTRQNSNQVSNQRQTPSPENIMEMVQKIKLRLEENPDDLAGWQAIAPIYRGLNLQDRARVAYSRIIELGGADASVYAEYADTLSLAASGVVTPEASDFAKKSLDLDPDNQLALWLAGLSAMQDNNSDLAISHWQRLMSLMSAFPQQQEELHAIIAEARANGSSSVLASSNENDSSKQAPPASDRQPPDQQLIPPEADVSLGINVSVSLDPQLTNIVKQEDTVFVVALATAGPPAPLAVKRLKVKDLPIKLRLSDSDAMLQQLRLSLFDEVDVSARISKSGQAIPQAGDLTSNKVSLKKVNGAFESSITQLLIDQQVGNSQ